MAVEIRDLRDPVPKVKVDKWTRRQFENLHHRDHGWEITPF